MRHRSSLLVMLTATVIIVGFAAFIAVQQNDSSLAGTPGQSGSPTTQFGSVTSTLISPDTQLHLRVVQIVRESNRWLFHLHAQNVQRTPATILSADHYFMLSGHGAPGTPVTASQIFRRLESPMQAGLAQSDILSHPMLAASVKGSGVADGWLVVDLTGYKYTPDGLMYVYGTVSSKECANPQKPKTCQPDVGYRAIIWNIL